ncbi:MAG: DUF1598 domain-containing protein [Planctomycetes bacterium]|nr:DUF1598 domain-containing protein [Planctomycetota bacterium]
MLSRFRVAAGIGRRVPVALLAVALVLAWGSTLLAQNNNDLFSNRGVGGVSIDPQGLLDNVALDDLGKLARWRIEELDDMDANLQGATQLRKISLRRLEAQIAKHGGDKVADLPDEIRYLAGLQAIHYVFVYPEENDIVLVGPAEGWKVDKRGNVVGLSTGRPVMLLDDLLVALRTAKDAARTGISCSINPTPEGLNQLQAHARRLTTIGNPGATAAGIEQALGLQDITVSGVPATTNFARVLVAADYRMKRLGMNFELAPVAGMPSFLHMMKTSRTGMQNMLPRWWMEPNYQPLLRDADGLAWEIRGAAVRTVTEEDFLTANGNTQHTGRKNPVAQKWADNMTDKFDELARAEPVFGQLRNCMDLAIVSALIVRQNLTGKAGYAMPLLMNADQLKVMELNAPKHVDSKASVLKRGRNWLISASGGVLINSWAAVERIEQSTTMAPVRTQSALPADSNQWWWN